MTSKYAETRIEMIRLSRRKLVIKKTPINPALSLVKTRLRLSFSFRMLRHELQTYNNRFHDELPTHLIQHYLLSTPNVSTEHIGSGDGSGNDGDNNEVHTIFGGKIQGELLHWSKG